MGCGKPGKFSSNGWRLCQHNRQKHYRKPVFQYEYKWHCFAICVQRIAVDSRKVIFAAMVEVFASVGAFELDQFHTSAANDSSTVTRDLIASIEFNKHLNMVRTRGSEAQILSLRPIFFSSISGLRGLLLPSPCDIAGPSPLVERLVKAKYGYREQSEAEASIADVSGQRMSKPRSSRICPSRQLGSTAADSCDAQLL